MAGKILLPGVGTEVLWTFFYGILFTVIVLTVTWKMFRYRFSRANSNPAPHHSYNNEVCPICISSQVLAVETNCGHKFCGSCIRVYLNNRSPGDFTIYSGRLTCPLCRQEINLLLLSFNQEEIRSSEMARERSVIETTVREYNIRFGVGPRSLWSYVRDCPVLMRHMIYEFFSFGGVVCMFRIRVILCFLAAVIYLGNPLDFVPEAVFGVFGFLDDLIVFLLCSVYISILYRRFVISRNYGH